MRSLSSLLVFALLSGCGTLGTRGRDFIPETTSFAFIPQQTQTQRLLAAIPPPQKPVAIAVYDFTDQTGQFKPTDNIQTLSRAVTQGAGSILVKALQDAGNHSWFTIVERESLKNLLSERQIIREMRERYLGEQGVNPQALPALLFAGVLLEGGIISYDTNTVTGGAGAAFLGIGGHTEYRQDTVTVYLRAVSVRTGEVFTTVTASKTIASKAISANAFKFVAFKELLQAEGGITTNEPDQLALQQAIEKAVYGLVMEGVELKLWNFADPRAGWPLLARYEQERDGVYSAAQVQSILQREGELSPARNRRSASSASRGTAAPTSRSGQNTGESNLTARALPPERLRPASTVAGAEQPTAGARQPAHAPSTTEMVRAVNGGYVLLGARPPASSREITSQGKDEGQGATEPATQL